ncbi:hypothetical protein [Arthrobacter sp. TB 26]|uniref:hypothetical protein n=1 Tax=Arthrobacter sp. TB 26 TaxID=494420 RepID=UPI0003FF38BC|nr:hypothetical protein [Arthrobacter sp. TB 26]
MTETCNTAHYKDRNVEPASLQACRECPFRKVNRGREHPDREPYTDPWLTRIWRRVSQEGGTFSCHMFDGGVVHYSDEIKAAGYKKPADIGGMKECAGMVAMVKRELDLIMTSPTFEQYQASRPAGLTQPAISYFLARIRGEVGPALRTSDYTDMAEILDMHDVVDTNGMDWKYDAAFLNSLSSLVTTLLPTQRECDCIVCAQHHTVHQMQPIHTAEGLDVQVDAELHPLLVTLASAGIRTTASCIDIHEAVTQLAPSWIGPMMNYDTPGGEKYQQALRRKAAFIELRNDTEPEKLFLAAAEKLPGADVAHKTSSSRVVFLREHIATLTAFAVLAAQHLAPKPALPQTNIPALLETVDE